ncbi:hypothetical protein CsSME_00022139 [Camellia sinensis var. sinensis]
MDTSVEVHAQEHEVVIALGSNVGDRLHNFNEALQLLKKSGIHIARHACLYETEPAYVLQNSGLMNCWEYLRRLRRTWGVLMG